MHLIDADKLRVAFISTVPGIRARRRRMHEELKACGDSPWLAGRAAASAGTALQLLAERAEYMAATGPEVRDARRRHTEV